jgi:hypothetical protein
VRRGPQPDPVRALLAPSTWLAAAHLLLDAVVGSAYAFMLVSGLFVTVLLMPFALLGLPVWIITAWLSAAMARIERARRGHP